MKSSTGEHYLALDHVRALAAFAVFCWHFLHGFKGKPIPHGYAPALFPLSFFDEGHIGVALFLVLSGYLFAKLLDGRAIDLPAFFWNRFIRLFPLLFVVTVAVAIGHKQGLADFVFRDLRDNGLPNGGWSIVLEAEFYIILPAMLFLCRRSPALLLLVITAAVATRAAIWSFTGTIQDLSYYTLLGRLDQFLLGMFAFYCRAPILRQHWIYPASLGLGAAALWWWFDAAGGLANPDMQLAWVFIPTLQGAACGLLIAWYDRPHDWPLSRTIARVGEWSYSIYLLHPFYVFALAAVIDAYVLRLTNFYVAMLAALVCFVATLPIAAASYHAIELPFLRLRRPYFATVEERVTAARYT